MAFSARATANARFELRDDARKDVLGVAYGRRNAEAIVEALNARFGAGEQLELELTGEAA